MSKEELQKIFETFDDNEKCGVRFGLFPHDKLPPSLSKEEYAMLIDMAERR